MYIDMSKGRDGGRFARLFQEKYPDEYDDFIDDRFATIRNNPTNTSQMDYESSREFTATLRRSNAKYLGFAPIENLQAIMGATAEMLLYLELTPRECAGLAAYGGLSVSARQSRSYDASLLAEIAYQVLLAMAEGRNNPVSHPQASKEDVQLLYERWRQAPGTTAGQYEALTEVSLRHSEFCAAGISFSQFLAEDEDDLTKRVLVLLSVRGASN